MPIPESLDTPEFRVAWSDWLADLAERGVPVTAGAARGQLETLEQWGPRQAIGAIKQSINAGYRTLYTVKPQRTALGNLDWVRQSPGRHRGTTYDPSEPEATF